jgi:hypothetical protein
MQKSESKIQQEIVIWYRNNNLNNNNVIFSVPNEGKSAKEQMFKKATGLMSGVSDLICINNGEILFIECKDEKGRQSDKQKEFEIIINSQGFKYFLVRSLEEFKKIVILAEQN